jgi:hypothetical protein
MCCIPNECVARQVAISEQSGWWRPAVRRSLWPLRYFRPILVLPHHLARPERAPAFESSSPAEGAQGLWRQSDCNESSGLACRKGRIVGALPRLSSEWHRGTSLTTDCWRRGYARTTHSPIHLTRHTQPGCARSDFWRSKPSAAKQKSGAERGKKNRSRTLLPARSQQRRMKRRATRRRA